ncbi:hypothetical protein SAMN05216420_11817 [Nitrosospira sp. Nl5]|nr:hypothetical protein SAMN05216420_11817 [Nitrosospira sp. Nl5]
MEGAVFMAQDEAQRRDYGRVGLSNAFRGKVRPLKAGTGASIEA